MYGNQEYEICELKNEILGLKEENRKLKDLINDTNEKMKEQVLDYKRRIQKNKTAETITKW